MNTQNTETPAAFVRAVESHFGIKFKYDMAASSTNAKAPNYFDEFQNSLGMDWPLDGWIWLNPPFRTVGAWAKKCRDQQLKGARIASIWPLSSDLNTIDAWKCAKVHPLHGRIWPLVRGCMLTVWDGDGWQAAKCLHWDRNTNNLTDKSLPEWML